MMSIPIFWEEEEEEEVVDDGDIPLGYMWGETRGSNSERTSLSLLSLLFVRGDGIPLGYMCGERRGSKNSKGLSSSPLEPAVLSPFTVLRRMLSLLLLNDRFRIVSCCTNAFGSVARKRNVSRRIIGEETVDDTSRSGDWEGDNRLIVP